MQLAFSTWLDVEEYLKRSKGVMIPVGSMEQHGPTGHIGTDAICAEAVALAASEQAGALVAPTISVGMSVHHTAFPGSMTLRPTTLIQVLIEHVFCLARCGFERFHFVNGHGGNNASINAAIWQIYAMAAESNLPHRDRIRLRNDAWYDLAPVNKLRRELFGDKEGDHATPSEIAITMYAHPDHIRKVGTLPPLRETRGTAYGALDFRKSFPDGRLYSDPSLATPELGRKVLETAAAEIARLYKDFMAEE